MVRLQARDIVTDDAANRGRRHLADVFDERLGDGVADQAEQGDQDEQAREDRLDAEIGQRRGPVLQVIVLVLPQRSLGRVTPGAAAQVLIPVVEAQQAMIPKNTVPIESKNVAALMRMVDALEEHDDVQSVFGNYEIDDKELEALA